MFIILSTIIGFFIGSFLLVVADRFGTDRSFASGRSVCEKCHVTLRAIDLLPVVSFVLLRGQCRSCHAKISWRYPAIECLTAILFGLTAWRYTMAILLPVGFLPIHLGVFLFRDLIFVSLLIVLFLIDARDGVLPDAFTLPGILFIIAINLYLGIPITTILIGGLIVGGFFAFQFFVSHGRWVGDGDIRLGALLGVMFGLAQGLLALMIAYIVGGLFAVVLLWKKKANIKSTLSFGPFLAIAGWIVLFFGSYLVRRYFSF